MNIPKLKKLKSIKKYHNIEIKDDYSWVDQGKYLRCFKRFFKVASRCKKIH